MSVEQSEIVTISIPPEPMAKGRRAAIVDYGYIWECHFSTFFQTIDFIEYFLVLHDT